MSDEGFVLEAAATARFFARAARHYGRAAVLAREVASRMAARLDWVKIAPSKVLDVGCGTGADAGLLQARYPQARYLGLDVSLPMLRAGAPARAGWLPWRKAAGANRVCAQAQSLPLAAGSVGLVWSNGMLHHLSEPRPVLVEAHRVLEVGGLLMFSCLGPDTLKELRALAAARVHRFIDMHDLGDALVAAGFAEPVMDMETITLTYAHFADLVADLRHTGGGCARGDRRRMSRSEAAQLASSYEQWRHEGRLPATFEIVYGHAWKPAPRHTAEGHAIVRFDPKQRGRG